MHVFCYNPNGYWGGLVQIEVDIRRGLPCIDIVGLAGGAVKEARERVRAAICNSGFSFPLGHVMVSLSPADIPKSGAAFDLAIAIAILAAANLDDSRNLPPLLIMGELTLSGDIRRVEAIVPALLEGQQAGIKHFVIPQANQAESRLIPGFVGIAAPGLGEAWQRIRQEIQPLTTPITESPALLRNEQKRLHPIHDAEFDFAIFQKQPLLLLALLAAAAGRHHILVYGPPGAGKTMALRFLGTLLPNLSEAQRLEVNRLHSLSGCIMDYGSLLERPPVRMPHHASSAESLLGGGKFGRPGELSLANNGLLILDEAAEFKKNLLQALREPMEDGLVRLGRVGGLVHYPANFILALSLNPCPCGRYGSGNGVCCCTSVEVQHYWARLGAPVIDRIDIRYRFGNAPEAYATDGLAGEEWRQLGFLAGLDSASACRKLIARTAGQGSPAGQLRGLVLERVCQLENQAQELLASAVARQGILARARHGILRLAKTMADLEGSPKISTPAIAAALALRSAVSPVNGINLFS